MRMNPHMEVVDFDDPGTFIQALQRTRDRWSDDTEYCTWYFRGQRKAEWSLLPTGFREHPMPELLKTYLNEADRWVEKHHIDLLSWLEQDEDIKRPEGIDDQLWTARLVKAGRFALAQVLVAREFVMIADYAKHAVRVPEELYLIMRENFRNYITGKLLKNPAIVRTLALAQHHGIPTVLLDWTYSPFAAAFFAAEKVLQKPGETSRFAVFGVHRSIVEADKHIRRLTLPPNTVSFLDAQEGLFFWCPKYYAKFLETGTFPDFDTLLEAIAGQLDVSAPEVGLVKYTLPAKHAKDVLRIIWREKVSPAHLRPSLDNVTEAIKMRSTWLTERPSTVPDVGDSESSTTNLGPNDDVLTG
jgi:hypothetical protein